MKNVSKLFGIIVLAAVIVFAMASCRSKGGANEIDSFLVDYEKFIDDYSVAMQKVSAGDPGAAADLEKYTAIFKGWQEKLQKFSPNDYTPEQLKKLTDLSTKLTESLRGLGN